MALFVDKKKMLNGWGWSIKDAIYFGNWDKCSRKFI